MDRHVKWLRRRIIASVATQAAETFAVVAVVAFAIMQWRTAEGPLSSLFGAVVIAQLFVVARIGFAMRNNPLNYVFMRSYVERPFNYRVARFQGDEEAHPAALGLPGFAPVATIRDADADPEPCFDIYHDPSRLVAAAVSRASGSLALVSSLSDGRILVTDARVVPPNERLVISLAEDDSFETVIASHQRAVAARTDVVELASSAHQVVLDSLTLEYESFLALGPALSPFFDLEPENRSMMRMSARIKTEELVTLPVRLGPDKPLPDVRVTAPVPVRVEPHTPAPVMAAAIEQPAMAPAGVPAPAVVAPDVVAPQLVITDVDEAAAAVLAPQIAAPEVVEEIPEIVEPSPALLMTPPAASAVQAAPSSLETEACDVFAAPVVVAAPIEVAPLEVAPIEPASVEVAPIEPASVEIAPIEPASVEIAPIEPASVGVAPIEVAPIEPASVEIAPPAFVTRDVEDHTFIEASVPITAEVPAVSFTAAPVPEPIAVSSLVAQRLSIEDITAPDLAMVAPVTPIAEQPVAPVAPVVEQLVVPVAPVVEQLVVPVAPFAEQPVVPVAPVVDQLPPPPLAPAATLAEAVVSAPDSPAALMDPALVAAPVEPAAAMDPAVMDPALAEAALAEPATNLAAALGFSDVTDRPRPRLSTVLREHPAAAPAPKRSRRKSR